MAWRIEPSGGDALIWVKVVPNASRDQFSGVIGERLKVRVSAQPEAGRANDAVCKLLARELGVKPRQVSVESGHRGPEKVIRIMGMEPEQVLQRIKLEG